MQKYILIIILSSFTHLGFCDVFSLKNGKVELDVPSDWRSEKDLFGLPLSILGPAKNGARPIVSVSSTPLKKIMFEDNFQESFKDYKKGRMSFLKKHNGEILSFLPYKKVKWKGIQESHQYGYKYKVAGLSYIETSYYIKCREKLFHLKSMDRLSEQVNRDKIEKIVRSFKCL